MAIIDSSYRVYAMIGDPVVQTKTTAYFNEFCDAAGLKAVMVPIRVESGPVLQQFIETVRTTQMIAGLVSTIPHKAALALLVPEILPTAKRLGAVNAVRIEADGTLTGDLFDGVGFLAAIRKHGFDPRGRTALVIGGGAAGSAIAIALSDVGADRVTICEPDPGRLMDIRERLGSLPAIDFCDAAPSQAAPGQRGYDLVANASPLGMRDDDPLPIDIDLLDADCFIADAVTSPAITPLLASARLKNCRTQTGAEMAEGQLGAILSFFGLKA